ncbi:MAG: protease [Acidobacteria bacterium]|nr:MAG: protease [Acidobacteriota bacterium]REJ99149.1 MAG: protease [Acidobacteriota bacterium]REK16130.1 MAG: protease [Acidobacteriota bacterium]REK43811.1 MAG: protease [Acidobacteriota bacterium]
MTKNTILTALLVLFLSVAMFPQSDAPMLFRSPTMNKTHITFVFAGDLWRVPRSGGTAERLTTAVGPEVSPYYSPDGKWIAFRAGYDGNQDIFVMPADGGSPRRVTYHPNSETVLGWTNDSRSIVFASGRTSSLPVPMMYTISVLGEGMPEELPFPMTGGQVSYSPDGSQIAYMPLFPAFNQWKMYRGGRTTKVWIGNMSDSAVVEIPRQNSNDFSPVWVGNKIYFLSDRNGRNVTLYSYDTGSKRVNEEVRNNGLDLKSLSGGQDGLVYEQFGGIYTFDPSSGRSQKVNITVRGDFPEVRPRYERVANAIRAAAISPNGARAVFEARGEIISLPAEKGNARNLTNTSGVADRDPAWSPDGKWIAYFSDESGEYALHLRDQSGMGEAKKVSLGNPSSYFYSPRFSPDSKKLMFTDKRLNIWYLEIESEKLTRVDTNTFENPFTVLDPSWSPDSQWIVYTKQLRNRMGAVHAYSLDIGKPYRLSDGMSDARYASFDGSGKYIYFTASTNSGPTTGWLDMSSFPFSTTRSVYAIVLKADEESPLKPESDEETVKAAEEGDKKPEEKKDEKKPEGPKVEIDLERIDQRIIDLPVANRDYRGLVAGKAGTFFLFEAVPPSGTSNGSQQGVTLHRFDMDKREATKVADNVNLFDITPNGQKMLVGMGPGRVMIANAAAPLKPGEGMLKLNELEVYVDPREEWKQMYEEAWRIQRDFFYDPGLHGINYEATKARYRPFLAGIMTRADLNYLFQEMLGNMTVGHHNSGGGDQPNPRTYNVGLLGADYSIENGRYRIKKIYNGENWNPGLNAPLTRPGLNVQEGEYIFAVNGRNVLGSDNIFAFFEQTAGRQTIVRVGPNADGSGARDVTVVPVGNEAGLRRLDWIEGNRRTVDRLSKGTLGYVYLPNTGGAGYTNFNRYYFAQIDKDGAVIDERFNGGGSAADYMIDYMRRPLWNYWSTREGEDFTTPVGSIYGPKTMIINEYAGSGGDLLPWLFREAKIGPLVGTRTWGGLVGIYSYPVLIDGGSVTAPRVAFRNRQGELDVENKGVAPDIVVDLDPKMWRQGRDIQLEKAVEVTLEAVRKNPQTKPKNGAFPDYSRDQ